MFINGTSVVVKDGDRTEDVLDSSVRTGILFPPLIEIRRYKNCLFFYRLNLSLRMRNLRLTEVDF